jgi:hypothetical protein
MAAEAVPRANVGILNHFEIAGFSWLGADVEKDQVRIFVDGKEVGRVPASTYRADLQKVGMGDGCCAFRQRHKLFFIRPKLTYVP